MERSDIRVITNKEGYGFIAKRAEEIVRKRIESTGVTEILDVTMNAACLISTTKQPEHYDEFGDAVVFGWDNIKWFGNFNDVSAAIQAISEASSNGYPIEFAKIGDEGTEHAYRHNDWESLDRHLEIIHTINIYKSR